MHLKTFINNPHTQRSSSSQCGTSIFSGLYSNISSERADRTSMCSVPPSCAAKNIIYCITCKVSFNIENFLVPSRSNLFHITAPALEADTQTYQVTVAAAVVEFAPNYNELNLRPTTTKHAYESKNLTDRWVDCFHIIKLWVSQSVFQRRWHHLLALTTTTEHWAKIDFLGGIGLQCRRKGKLLQKISSSFQRSNSIL